jgi:maltose alpha-D-glucosyltransferase/alpha-amylase
MRTQFLRGYLGAANGSPRPWLPAPEHVDRWVRLFEVEKAWYEVEYEARNRPAWAHLPLQGLLRMIGEPGV